jgi:2-pyrone-4,6-dicarboxylate lactonase
MRTKDAPAMPEPPTCRGPDPNPQPPREALPDGACDAHSHVFGPRDRFPYAPDRPYTPPDAPFEGLRRVHDVLGIGRAVIVQARCHGTDHRATLDAIARSFGRWRGVGTVDGHESDRDFAALHDGGIRGVRFGFVRHLGGAPDLRLFERTLDRLPELGWHLVLHVEGDGILDWTERLRRLRVPFVIDHMARVRAADGLDQPAFRALLDLMRHPLAWVKISGPERISATGAPFLDAVPFARALVAAAPDRVLWGIDWPHPNVAGDMPNDGHLVDLLHLAVPDVAGRRAVLVDNPTRLYWPETLHAAG